MTELQLYSPRPRRTQPVSTLPGESPLQALRRQALEALQEQAAEDAGQAPPHEAHMQALRQRAQEDKTLWGAPDAPPAPAESPAPAAAAAKQPSLLRDAAFLLAKIAAIALVLALVFTFVYGVHRVAEPGMRPAVQDGDVALYYRLNKDYAAGDVLMLTYRGQTQMRRVVAVAGDVVDMMDGGLMVNGALQQELNIYQPTERYVDGVTFPLTVGEGQVFVLADARENATDSRVYGPVNAADTLGTVITLLRRRNI